MWSREFCVLSCLRVAAICLVFVCTSTGQTLEERFADPPHEYSLVPFWAWNGTLDPQELRRQIDEMLDKGVYGAFMHARVGIESGETPYFSEGWWRAVDACVEYGAQRGFKTWIYDEDKWPSGSAGGRVLQKNPERNSQKALRHVQSRVTGPADVPVAVEHARFVVAGRLVGENALDPASLTDLSPLNGTGHWQCPEGEWLIIGYVFGPYHDGVNYMNSETVRDFIDVTHEEYARRYGTHFGSTIPGVFFDEIMNDAGKSPEHHVWVEDFEARFREIKGYDLVPLLPGLSHDIGPTTPRVRCDYYDVFTTLYEEAWFKQIADWCAQHHLKLTGHTVEDLNRYITQGDYVRTMSHLQIPTADNEDFRYTWPRTIGAWKPKQAASIAHLYNWPQAGSEALGGPGWAFNLDMARYGFNMLSAYGLTFFVPHYFGYAMDSPATMDDWPSSWFVQNPYWKYFRNLADHLRRVSFMLSDAEPVIDVAVLYPQCNQWSGYGPGTTQLTVEQLVASQIDVDVIDSLSLLNAEIQGGVLSAGRARYRVLIVPGLRCLRRAEAQQIHLFVQSGGLVIMHDTWPTDSAEEGREDPFLLQFRNDLEKLGVTITSPEATVSRIEEALGRDVEVIRGNPANIRYQHVRKDGHEIYWIVNGGRAAFSGRLRLRSVGVPELWSTETGKVTRNFPFSRRGALTECDLQLDPGQGLFLVFNASAMPPDGGTEIASTTLREVRVESLSANVLRVEGWLPAHAGVASVSGRLLTERGEKHFDYEEPVESTTSAMVLSGGWTFLAVGDRLDREWSVDVHDSELEVPVARIRWELSNSAADDGWQLSSYEDSEWRRIKILDTLHPDAGANRYRSRWRGRFITLNRYHPFELERFYAPVVGGKNLQCRKLFVLPPDAARVRVAVVCPSPFQVYIDDALIGEGGGGEQAAVIESAGLRAGETTLRIVAADAQALLAEGVFVSDYGAALPFCTNDTWQVSLDGSEWLPAWEYVSPPEKPYGEPDHPFGVPMPETVLYRLPLPPGTVAVRRPDVEGDWALYANGVSATFEDEWCTVSSRPDAGVLALRVTLGPGQHGLMRPIRVRCVPVEAPLSSWTGHGLDWYSGRALYSRSLSLTESYCQDDVDVELDLGRVGFCAEVWVNGQLAGTRVWPPYRVHVTDLVRPGANRIDVVVANLLANRMRWDIFDDVKSNLQHRKWHDDGILRDAWCLESGLVGPVSLQPSRRVAFNLPVQ
ncbi:MAG: hypothetical protein IT365_07865 [Candidatus Hydrogenedentes bacterium]|nr:hypothetical protein [Candidatus Hydrogenedentota bacterium]